jgi:predicted ABC-type transport system involved in lysophospholipase L1 biosynthesis ATPase subunit
VLHPTESGALVIDVQGLVKDYRSLRPLRLRALQVHAGERVVVSGLDAAAAEILVNILNGAVLPDEGHVSVLGQMTRDVADGDAWLASLDRFGIVTPRAVLLEAMTVAQNLALPLTLEIEPMSAETAQRAADLGARVGLAHDRLGQTVATIAPDERMRLHLARATALEPSVLLFEHPTTALAGDGGAAFGALVRGLAQSTGLTILAFSEDQAFAHALDARHLKLKPATGELSDIGRRWFR